MGNSESGVEPSHSHFRFFSPDNSKVASMMAAVLKPSPDRARQNPVFCLMAGMDSEMQRSKSTAFCLSCHIMGPYGKSLHVDDPAYLAAAHCQNHRVSADLRSNRDSRVARGGYLSAVVASAGLRCVGGIRRRTHRSGRSVFSLLAVSG